MISFSLSGTMPIFCVSSLRVSAMNVIMEPSPSAPT